MVPSQLLGCTACNIVLYCASGYRSKRAADKLASLGFTGGIYDGLGIQDWQASLRAHARDTASALISPWLPSPWQGAGYPTVRTPSRDDPACAQAPGLCSWQRAPEPSFPPNVPDGAPQVRPGPSPGPSLSLRPIPIRSPSSPSTTNST